MHQVQDSLFALPPRKEGRWLSKIFSVVRTPNASFETNLLKYLRHCLDALRSFKTCRSDPQPSNLRRKVLHSCLPHAVGIFRRQVISSCREHSLLSQVLVSAALRIASPRVGGITYCKSSCRRHYVFMSSSTTRVFVFKPSK